MISTHIVRLTDSKVVSEGRQVFTTREGLNPGGSIKDHMVYGELSDWLKKGVVKAGDRVSEVTSGSTGFSLAYYAQYFGLTCDLFLPLEFPLKLQEQLIHMGAHLHLVPREEAYEQHEFFCKNSGSRAFNQLYDSAKSRHYQTWGESIQRQIGNIDCVMGAIGTGHSLKGVAKAFPEAVCISVEPEEGCFISGIRNISTERYGLCDTCNISDFYKRIVLAPSEFFNKEQVITCGGLIHVGDTFKLVLGALKFLNDDWKFDRILAIGANNT